MKTLLVFPPFVPYALSRPYLSVPLLAGYLAKRGVAADQRDLNLEFFHHLATVGTFGGLIAEYQSQLEALEQPGRPMVNAGRGPDPSSGEADRRLVLQRLLQARCLYRHVEWMKNDPAFFLRVALALTAAKRGLGAPAALDDLATTARASEDGSLYAEFFRDVFWRTAGSQGYRVVGFSVAMAHQLIPALSLARMIAEKDESIHIVFGGAALNLAEDATLVALGSLPYIHSIVRFGGGKTLLEIVEGLARRTELPDLANHIDCRGPGQPRFPRRYEPADVDECDDCLFDKAILSRYPTPCSLPVLYARGCYWGRCAFCSYPATVSCKLRAPAKVADQLGRLTSEYGIHSFEFIGDSLPPRYGVRVAEEIRKRNLKVTFGSFARVERGFDREVLQKLASVGYAWTTIGVESTVDRILALMEKGSTFAMLRPQLEACKEAGVAVTLNLIIDFPSMTAAEALQVLTDVRELAHLYDGLSCQTFSLERGTIMWRRPEAFGIEIVTAREPVALDPVSAGTYRSGAVPFIDSNGMSRAEREGIVALYRALERETGLRPFRSMLWTSLRRNGAWIWEWKWPLVTAVARELLIVWPPTSAPRSSNSRQCYNFVEDALIDVDEKAGRRLVAMQSTPSVSFEELAARLARDEACPRETMEEELRAAVQRCIVVADAPWLNRTGVT